MTEQEKREKKLKNFTILFLVLYLIGSYLVLHFGTVVAIYDGFDLKLLPLIMEDFNYHLNAFPVFIPATLAFKYWFYFTVAYGILVAYYFTTRKKFMVGKEYGTAQWGGKNDIKPLIDKSEENNIIFTQTEAMSVNREQTGRNLNTLVIGGPGMGKTNHFVKPNILQAHSSYVITDPNGVMLRETGAFLQQQGYKIKVLNLVQREYSDGYNPFNYMHGEADVLTVIYALVENTSMDAARVYEQFQEKAEIALLEALFYYVWYEYPKKDQNMVAVFELLRKADTREDDENYISELDEIFIRLTEKKPNHIAVKQYTIFKQSAGKLARSILVSAGTRLTLFNLQDVVNITARDTLELEKLGQEKTALFVVVSDAYMVFNFLAALLYEQLFETLYGVAESSPTGKLHIPVRCLMDEFFNLGKLMDFERLVGTMNVRNLSVTMLVNNLSQIKSLYEGTFETIVNNCDSLLFMGSMDQFTLEYISTALGKETIDTSTYSYSKEPKWQRSSTTNYDVMGRELMLPDELARMPSEDCILIIKGTYPFYSKKYDVTKHKNYKFTNSHNPHYLFDYRTVRRVKKFEPKAAEAGEKNTAGGEWVKGFFQ